MKTTNFISWFYIWAHWAYGYILPYKLPSSQQSTILRKLLLDKDVKLSAAFGTVVYFKWPQSKRTWPKLDIWLLCVWHQLAVVVNNVVWKKTSRTDRIEFNYIYSKGIKVALTLANFWFFHKYVGRECVFIHRQEPNQSLILVADFIMRCPMNTLSDWSSSWLWFYPRLMRYGHERVIKIVRQSFLFIVRALI